jgi:hypothetical protein
MLVVMLLLVGLVVVVVVQVVADLMHLTLHGVALVV